MTTRPDPLIPHGLYVTEENEQPVTMQFVGNLDDVINLIVCADRLHLGWSAQGYHCPTSDENETIREYRITVWREVMSDTLTWVPQEARGEQS